MQRMSFSPRRVGLLIDALSVAPRPPGCRAQGAQVKEVKAAQKKCKEEDKDDEEDDEEDEEEAGTDKKTKGTLNKKTKALSRRPKAQARSATLVHCRCRQPLHC